MDIPLQQATVVGIDPGGEGHLRDRVPLLDHGYVERVLVWGSDQHVVENARQSTGKGFLGWGPRQCECVKVVWGPPSPDCPKCNGTREVPGDEKLLRRLWTHKHTTPFEAAGMTVEVQAPIFVFREWHRHRTQSYNEMSARYAPLPDMYYVPSLARLKAGKQNAVNKQGSTEGFTEMQALQFQETIEYAIIEARAAYEQLLEQGLARELARLVVPVAQYSRMRASANLWNWLHFLTLRMAPDAQWEIRQYANVVGQLIAREFPRTWALFAEGRERGREVEVRQPGPWRVTGQSDLLAPPTITWFVDNAQERRQVGPFVSEVEAIVAMSALNGKAT